MNKIEMDLKIKDLDTLFSNTLISVTLDGKEECIENIKEVISWFHEEVEKRVLFKERGLFKEILNNVMSNEGDRECLSEAENFLKGLVVSLDQEVEESV